MSNLPKQLNFNTPNIAIEERRANPRRRASAVVAAIALLTTISTAPARANDPGWTTEQTGSVIKHSRFSATAKGFRTDSIEAGYSVVAEAPLWKFFMFNDSSKLYFPFNTIPGHVTAAASTSLLRATMFQNNTESVWSKAHQSKSLGHPMTVWRMSPKDKKQTSGYNVLELWTANDIPISPAVGQFGYAVNGYPKELLNIPIHLYLVHADGAKETLMTTKAIKPAMLPASLFKVPRGYKLARNEMEVVMNTQDLTNILDGIR